MSWITGADWDRVDTEKKWALGTIGQGHDGKLYKYVTYTATEDETSEVDRCVYYVAATGYAANAVTLALIGSDDVGAGVATSVLANGEFGWIQIRGRAVLTVALGSTGDGIPLTATNAADGSLTIPDQPSDYVCAVAGDHSANEIYCNFPY